jgi:hypothetical protein
MPEENTNKRRFSRIPFDATVRVTGEQQQWDSQLLDISLKGALVKQPEGWNASEDGKYNLDITLSENIVIHMEASISHTVNQQIGFRCDHIDLDSISHLRRIVELNTGSEELLNRELSALTSMH